MSQPMKPSDIIKTVGTTVVVGATLLALHALWIRFQVVPITRDGKVRADVVQVTPDVSGWVTKVQMRENAPVREGQVVLVLDRARYQLALDQAEATAASQRVALAQAVREDKRNHAMANLVAAELIEEGAAKVDTLRASLAQAVAARDLAKLNLERTLVRAPVDGIVANMSLQPGDYLTAGKTAAVLVYTKSMRVEGYFEETKMGAVHVGDRARIRLMGLNGIISGHVESIAAGVEDRERNASESMLANVNPTFTWVRLAQRIPVRVAIDRVPANQHLIVGETATVEIVPDPDEPAPSRSYLW